LRIVAASMISGASTMGADELELALLEYAAHNMKKVSSSLEANDTRFHGQIQLAVENRVLIPKQINEIWRWYINTKDGNEEELCIVPMGENYMEYMKKDIRNNFETKMTKLIDAVNGYREAEELEEKMKNMTVKKDKTLEMVEDLLNDGILYLERNEKSVYFVVDDKPEKFIELQDLKGWLGQVVEMCKKGKAKEKLRSVYDKSKQQAA